MIKADRDCASAAAASVIAKVARDALMTELHDELPAYNWARNKGYASPDHREAIRDARAQPRTTARRGRSPTGRRCSDAAVAASAQLSSDSSSGRWKSRRDSSSTLTSLNVRTRTDLTKRSAR